MKKHVLLALALLGIWAGAAGGLTSISAYKSFTREVLTSSDLNSSFSTVITGVNNVIAKFPGDSVKVGTGAMDTLVANPGPSITVKFPLFGLDGTDTTKFFGGNYKRIHIDSLNTKAPVVSWAYDFSAGNPLRAAKANVDTLAMRGTTSGTITAKGAAAAGTWTWTWPTGGGTANYPLITDGSGTSSWTLLPVPGGGLGVATLASNGVLYGNGTGVVQVTSQGSANSVLTANAGAPAFSASPTIGTSVTTPALLCTSNDGGAIGASGTAFSDLFLASGAVINFLAGDVTITHGSNTLDFAGAATRYSFDAPVLIGTTTANTFNTLGGTINQGVNDNEILSLKSSDIAHGKTTDTETDTYGAFYKTSATLGGLGIIGWGESGQATGLYLKGSQGTADATKSTSAKGAVGIQASLTSGTSDGLVSADGNLVYIMNHQTTRFIFDAEGTGHADDVWTDNAFDLAESYDVFYAPAKGGAAIRRSKYWSDKDTSWVAEVDTVEVKAGAATQAEEGTVLTVDITHDNRLTPTTSAYQVIAGIISYHTAQLGDAMGSIMEKYPQLALGKPANSQPVALVGIVPTKLTNDNGDIRRGDVLVAADRDGYAMKIGALPLGLVLTSRHIVGVALMECDKPECFGNVQR